MIIFKCKVPRGTTPFKFIQNPINRTPNSCASPLGCFSSPKEPSELAIRATAVRDGSRGGGAVEFHNTVQGAPTAAEPAGAVRDPPALGHGGGESGGGAGSKRAPAAARADAVCHVSGPAPRVQCGPARPTPPLCRLGAAQ